MENPSFILASSSHSRRQLLKSAGLHFKTHPSDIDEDAIKSLFLKQKDQADMTDLATILASAKASVVSEKFPHKLVLGADQILILENTVLSKPSSFEDAREHLLRLRGKTHSLHSALSIALGNEIIWTYTDSAHLSMREFSPEFLGQYLAATGADVLTTVGGYRLEGEGIQLFRKIVGDYFTILGLPLLPILEFLRERGLLKT